MVYSHPTFTDLPREIRDMIYELCLCVEGDIFPYKPHSYPPYEHNKEKGPTLAMLALSRGTRNEARPVFYGKNIFRLTTTSPTPRHNLGNGKMEEGERPDTPQEICGSNGTAQGPDFEATPWTTHGISSSTPQ